jgi:hypothetical protein
MDAQGASAHVLRLAKTFEQELAEHIEVPAEGMPAAVV